MIRTDILQQIKEILQTRRTPTLIGEENGIEEYSLEIENGYRYKILYDTARERLKSGELVALPPEELEVLHEQALKENERKND